MKVTVYAPTGRGEYKHSWLVLSHTSRVFDYRGRVGFLNWPINDYLIWNRA